MADIVDRAQELEERHREAALISHRQRASACVGQGRFHCIDCGNQIAPARRRANPSTMRCAPCQNAAEHQESHSKNRRVF